MSQSIRRRGPFESDSDEDQGDVLRSFSNRDASEPRLSISPRLLVPSIIEEDLITDRPSSESFERAFQQARAEALTEKFQQEYDDGLVVVHQETEEVLARADTMHELSQELADLGVDPEETLMVRCNEP